MSTKTNMVDTIQEASVGPSVHGDHGIHTPTLHLTIDDGMGTFEKELGTFDGGLEAIAFLRRQKCSVDQLVGRRVLVYEESMCGFIHSSEFDLVHQRCTMAASEAQIGLLRFVHRGVRAHEKYGEGEASPTACVATYSGGECRQRGTGGVFLNWDAVRDDLPRVRPPARAMREMQRSPEAVHSSAQEPDDVHEASGHGARSRGSEAREIRVRGRNG